jgi:hypothetical protein
MAARKRREGRGERRGERQAPPAPSPVAKKKAAAKKAAAAAERSREQALAARRQRDQARREAKRQEQRLAEQKRQEALARRRDRARAKREAERLEAERAEKAKQEALARRRERARIKREQEKLAKKPKKPAKPKKPKKKPKKPRTIYEDLGDLYDSEVKSGEIALPADDRIHRRDNYGHTYDKSIQLGRLTNADIYDQLPDILARLTDAAGELNDFVRNVPDAIRTQAVPRFWTTVEFLIESKSVRKGSPKKFFRKRRGKQMEFALTYDGHPAVRLERYRREVDRLFKSLAAGPPILLFVAHVGATFEAPRRKRRRR